MKYLFPFILAVGGFFLLIPSLTSAAFPCWPPGCSDPGKIQVGCTGDQCSIAGGFSGVTNAVGGTLTKKTITEYVVDVVLYFLGFVTLIAVIYIIYAGFQLMIGGGDEEKVKKARQIITYVIAGIILMWVAYWLVVIIIESLN